MQKLNTTLVYILSIVGLLCCCVGIGWIFSLVALIIANKGLKKYKADPDQYENGHAMKSARIVAIISLIISALVGIFVLYIIIMLTTSPEFACEFWSEAYKSVENNPDVQEEGIEFYRQMRDEACAKI